MDYDRLLRIGRDLLEAIGSAPDSPELEHTPRRWADWWREFIEYEPGQLDTVFHSHTSTHLVVVAGMRAWSICEHHLLPFWCDVTIGYVPAGQVLGLSKFARVTHLHAHRPQIQERLVDDIAADIVRLTGSDDVIVMASGVHLCMSMRGIRTDAVMTSVAARGIFNSESDKRREFIELARQRTG